ncbi:ThiF family adenylyltransferase [Muricauda sp. SCSIO 64092]|uniref:ThiF family adenylyltransferase n=1 Tax=Allomuricauda sp. SCSIO 64092 TaxID=2908842 RepID=UPI001FF6C703|nr:ThiF family adenylyltransferase [Muricauda sp. SCSIO 64092]UOY05012.1 ThiF family adenylyltransferase [Muricauda sp. SCSIO 64092]
MNYDRIKDSVDIALLERSHIVVVGAGGAKHLILNLARSGVGQLTILDIDTVDDTNIVRQGYDQADIGRYKVDALKEKVQRINPDVTYRGITDNFLEMNTEQLDSIFEDADMILMLTDAFSAQSFGNIVSLSYLKPALWAGWYAKSRTAEIFFQIPGFTPACFRCAVSSRYKANEQKQVVVSSQCNTIFHSELLDSLIGLLTLAILHRNSTDMTKESVRFFHSLLNDDGSLDWNFLQFKAHPEGGNPLFDRNFGALGKRASNFVSHWQQVEPELKPAYPYDCPDCQGVLNELVKNTCNHEH